MSFDIANNSLQQTAFILTVVAAAVAMAATALRFAATRCAHRKFSWEDWFAVLATLFFVAYAVPFLYILRIMNGRSPMKLSAEEVVKTTKAGYVMAAQFCLQQLFAKLSLLCLYYRLFYIRRAFVRCIYILGALQLIWSIATFMVHWFLCSPPQKLWDKKLPGSCINAPAFLAAGEPPNSLMDFALIAMAIWIVQSLHMTTATKVKLSFLFALGGLAGIMGFVKIGLGFSPMRDERIALLDPIWAVVQQSCAVICCSAPVYKPLMPDLGFLQTLSSFGSRSFGGRAGSRNKPASGEMRVSPAPTDSAKARKNPYDWVQLEEHRTSEPSLSRTSS
ncbi:hypothetical protein CDD81_707 [Ophiocordyceps australis]|uniref:Rhodopsin domain-containing protein n=1 Tax=Ophiocordyceps australis TaxID=1399860 RepID=A0A2C5Y2I5_9HYPO|nr:hypothetical protein CDD81_707 [Ophiocordyceps australis]